MKRKLGLCLFAFSVGMSSDLLAYEADGLFAVQPIQMTMRQNMGRIQQFPHRPPMVATEASLTPHD